MIDIKKVKKIKSATIAIGLLDNKNFIRGILGSGVIVDPEGWFITATHNINNYEKNPKLWKKIHGIDENEVLWLVILNYTELTNKKGNLHFNKIYVMENIDTNPSFHVEGYDIDITYGRVSEIRNYPFLPIANNHNFSVLEEIYLCGYPGGGKTFTPISMKKMSETILDMRMSPVIQPGRIGALSPADNIDLHYGMVTDIIGTGLSSGSPIVDRRGDIIALAQTVLSSGLEAYATTIDTTYSLNEETEKLNDKELERNALVKGYAQIGLVTGLTSNVFQRISIMIERWKKGEYKMVPNQFDEKESSKFHKKDGSLLK